MLGVTTFYHFFSLAPKGEHSFIVCTGTACYVKGALGLLDRLVESGRSVIVIEHHQAVMAHADWIIDLGPGAGHDGGRIVFEGTPSDLIADRSTLTGQHLAEYVAR